MSFPSCSNQAALLMNSPDEYLVKVKAHVQLHATQKAIDDTFGEDDDGDMSSVDSMDDDSDDDAHGLEL
jgi:hypothetical protein